MSQKEIEVEPELKTGCCHPASTPYRYLGLLCMCLFGFGSYFCYDNLGALQDVFQRELDLSATQFTLLYSICFWPNIVLSLVGGFLMDRVFGIRLGSIIYMSMLLVGQLIFATGGLIGAYWVMIVGRFIFGAGNTSLVVAQHSYAVVWFMGKELNMVFGLEVAVSRLSSTANFWVMQPLYNYVSEFYEGNKALGVVLFISSSLCAISLIGTLVLGYMDRRAERILKRNINPSGKIPKLSDILKFKLDFWMISVACVIYYVTLFPFISIGQDFFMKDYGMTADEANTVNSIFYLVSAVTMPFIGILIDKIGRNVTWMFVATVSSLVSQSILSFANWTPYIGVTLLGLSYSMLATSLWPILSMIVPEYQLGTAYGCCHAVQSLGLSVVPVLTGIVLDNNDGDHFWVQILFMALLLIALIPICILWTYDRKNQRNLNLSASQRSEYLSHLTVAKQSDEKFK